MFFNRESQLIPLSFIDRFLFVLLLNFKRQLTDWPFFYVYTSFWVGYSFFGYLYDDSALHRF